MKTSDFQKLHITDCKLIQQDYNWHELPQLFISFEFRPCKNCLYNDGTCKEAKEGAQQAWTSRHMPVK